MEAGGGLVTDDLAVWLLACIAEDEQIATNDGRVKPAEWTALATGPESDWSAPWEVLRVGGVAFRAVDHEARHAANWDPKRVLAECDTKRRIIEMHKPESWMSWDDDAEVETEMQYCLKCAIGASCSCCLEEEDKVWPCDTLKLLALPYADRPGYREEWGVA